MEGKNKGIVLHGIKDLRLDDLPIQKMEPNEVLLKMGCVGICGSDLTHWRLFAQGTRKLIHPKVMGHEPAGTVFKLGSNVTHLKIGDRVAVEPGVPCSSCNWCKIGHYNHCEKCVFPGSYPKPGALQNYYVHNANFVHKLPETISLEEGALLQPLSIALHAVKRGDVKGNSKVLIMGSGTIGLSVLLCAKAYGASKIIIADLVESRLKKAKEIGADFTYLVKPNEDDKTTTENMLKIFGERPTVTFECAGEQHSTRVILNAAEKKGVAVIVGMGTPEYTLPIFDPQCKELDIRGAYRLCNDYPTAIDLVVSNKINITPLITHRVGLEDFKKAFELADKKEDNCIKVMFHIQ